MGHIDNFADQAAGLAYQPAVTPPSSLDSSTSTVDTSPADTTNETWKRTRAPLLRPSQVSHSAGYRRRAAAAFQLSVDAPDPRSL